MAKKSGKGLGRGLNAIFATENVELVTDNDKVLEISLEEIKKNCIDKPKEWIADKIAALNVKSNQLKQKMEQDGEKAPWYKKLVAMVAKAIAYLTEKMTSVDRRERVDQEMADAKAKKDAEADITDRFRRLYLDNLN